jgi:rare lipoprotein A
MNKYLIKSLTIFFSLTLFVASCESPNADFRTKRKINIEHSNLSHNSINKKNKKTKRNVNIIKNIDNITPEDVTKSSYSGYYKIGKAYKIYGIEYVPQKYNNLEQIGEASWYGEKFHGKMTANGEIYNMNSLTAAHRTLPLPSIVEVKNLTNGRIIKVRVNDRGPFAKDRIIDLSKKAATILGFKEAGKTNVKVKYLSEETEELLNKLNLVP